MIRIVRTAALLTVLGLLAWTGWRSAIDAADRSSRWPAVRDAYLATHPTCAACGSATQIEVHHVRPFHRDRDLELDADNLITLCRGRDGRGGCHLILGHWHDWRGPGNRHVREDAAYFRLLIFPDSHQN